MSKPANTRALNAALRTAYVRRAPLREARGTDCYRVSNGAGDGLPGFTLDLFADVAVLSLYEEKTGAEEMILVAAAANVTSARSVYLKRRPREARVVAVTQQDTVAPGPPFFGEAVPELVAKESGLSFLIRPAQGLSVGLYLDMREGRDWIRRHAEGRTVLNCFSYTCGFALASLTAGAVRVVNVDQSRKVLEWGEENARLNRLPVDPRDYVAADVMEWLPRLAKTRTAFDLVILDPPSFSKGKRGTFSAASDYAELAEGASRLVSTHGRLFACCNLAKLSLASFQAQVLAGVQAAGRKPTQIRELGPSTLDFPPAPGHPPALKLLAVQL